MPCRPRCYMCHIPLVSIQLCLVLPPPSSSSCTSILLSTFLSLDLFSKHSLVALFLCGLVVSTVAPVWLVMLSSFLRNVCSSYLIQHWPLTGFSSEFFVGNFVWPVCILGLNVKLTSCGKNDMPCRQKVA